MANKILSNQMRWESYATLGEWAGRASIARLPTEQQLAYQAPISNDLAIQEPECTAYGAAVSGLFLEWKTACRLFCDTIRSGGDEAELQRQLDRLAAVLGRASALPIPERARAIQRVFLAMLRSGASYYQSFVDDADQDAIRQQARDYLEAATLFSTEFDRFLRAVGQPF